MSLLAFLLAAATASVDATGQVRFPARASATSVVLTLRAPDRQRDDVVVTCPLASDASFRCSVPSGVFDVRAAIPGFLPVYRWGVEFKKPETKLGIFTAQRSSSVAGSVVDARHRRPLGDATVELLERGEKPAVRQTAKSNAHGFFQLTDVDPGAYVLRVTSKGASPAYRYDIVVREREETLVKDIAVSPLSRLSINITPPMRAPGQEWKLELSRQVPMTPYSRTVGRKFAEATGTADFDGLENGFYFLSVFDGTGTVFAHEAMQIDGDPPPLNIRLSLVPIRGRVKSGTTGLKARVEFQSRKGPAVRLQSDENGDFEGVLPEDGRWSVSVILPSRQDVNFRGVEIKRRDTEEYARVDLELPAGRLEGRVVDESGNGVSTGVRLTRGRMPESGTLSNADGHFVFVGLQKIDAVLDAGDGDLMSAAVPVSISDDGPPVTITVRKSRRVQGWITTPAGYPVVGAAIEYWPEGFVWSGRAMSNPSGLFELTLPATARYVDVFVGGAGVPVMLKRAAIPEPNERLRLVTAAVPGRLLLRLTQGIPPYPVISRDGVNATLNLILWPGHVSGVPPQGVTPEGYLFDVEPGRYSVCLNNDCKSVDVAPAAQMKVDLGQ